MNGAAGAGKTAIAQTIAKLSSILTITSRSIQLFHASFPDFLFDESRSGSFFIQGYNIPGAVSRACFRCIPRCKFRVQTLMTHNFSSDLLYIVDNILDANIRRICCHICCYHPQQILARQPRGMLEVPADLRRVNLQRFFHTLSASANILFIAMFMNRLLKEQVRPGVLLQRSTCLFSDIFSPRISVFWVEWNNCIDGYLPKPINFAAQLHPSVITGMYDPPSSRTTQMPPVACLRLHGFKTLS